MGFCPWIDPVLVTITKSRMQKRFYDGSGLGQRFVSRGFAFLKETYWKASSKYFQRCWRGLCYPPHCTGTCLFLPTTVSYCGKHA